MRRLTFFQDIEYWNYCFIFKPIRSVQHAVKTLVEEPRRFEFSFPRLDTLASVVSTADGIIIRTSRATFSEERKAAFIRQLSSEGFIAADFRWSYSSNEMTSGRVSWLVEPDWWLPGKEVRMRTSRFMFGVIASSAFLWLVMMGLLFWRAAR